jgi:hypothetical protein
MIAEFHPQAWVNDQAIEIDHDEPDTWDCSVAFATMPPDYRAALLADIAADGEALDRHDWLKDDPAAPEWVREHSGPFDIYVREG